MISEVREQFKGKVINMNILKKINDKFEEYLAALLLVIMTLLIFFQVVSRFIFNAPLAWSEETARYAFVWLIYISAALAVKKGAHIRVEIGLHFFKGIGRKIAFLLTDILFLIFTLFLVKDGAFLVKTLTSHNQISPAVGYSMNLIYLIIPFGYGLMTIRLIGSIIHRIKGIVKNEELEDELDQQIQD